jgi:hypothetical protein
VKMNAEIIRWLTKKRITAIDVSGALDVVGDLAVATDKFTVAAASGNTVVGGTLAVTGNVAVATNKFTVAAASGNTLVAGTLAVTSDVAVATNKFTVAAATGNTLVAGTLDVTGDIAAGGGFRQMIGPFTAPGAAGVTAASQTNLDMRYSHTVTAAALSFVATRAGSIMGLSAHLSAAITGAATTITVAVTKNGTEVALTAALTQAGGEVVKSATAAKGSLTFVADDIIGVSYTSTGISNTPALVATIEIES